MLWDDLKSALPKCEKSKIMTFSFLKALLFKTDLTQLIMQNWLVCAKNFKNRSIHKP